MRLDENSLAFERIGSEPMTEESFELSTWILVKRLAALALSCVVTYLLAVGIIGDTFPSPLVRSFGPMIGYVGLVLTFLLFPRWIRALVVREIRLSAVGLTYPAVTFARPVLWEEVVSIDGSQVTSEQLLVLQCKDGPFRIDLSIVDDPDGLEGRVREIWQEATTR